MKALLFVLTLFTTCALAGEPTKIYQTDRYGRPQLAQPGTAIIGDTIYLTDRYGRPQMDKPVRKIVKDTTYQTDTYGRPQMNKPVLKAGSK